MNRRTFLGRSVGVLGVATASALAGCGSEDPSPGLHAVSATIVHRPGLEDLSHPEDIAVRATVENTSRDRRSGTLSVTLERSSESPLGTGSWTKTRTFDLQSITTRSFIVGFEGVVGDGDSERVFTAEATVTDQRVV